VANAALRNRGRKSIVVGAVNAKSSLLRTILSISRISSALYVLSVMYAKLCTTGGAISSYLDAMNMLVIPTSCNRLRWTISLERYRSMKFAERKRVSGRSLNSIHPTVS
jgi:hypothetical protein